MITDLEIKNDKRIKQRKCLHGKVVRTQYWDSKKAEYVNTWHCAKCNRILSDEEVNLF